MLGLYQSMIHFIIMQYTLLLPGKFSHRGPEVLSLHIHSPFLQVPPFWHGLDLQSNIDSIINGRVFDEKAYYQTTGKLIFLKKNIINQ